MCSSESLTFCHPQGQFVGFSPGRLEWQGFFTRAGSGRLSWQLFLGYDKWLLKHGLCNNTLVSVSLLSLTCGFLICFLYPYCHTSFLGNHRSIEIWSLNAGFYWTTLPKFDMEPKNNGFQKESPIPGCHFQVNHVKLRGGYLEDHPA